MTARLKDKIILVTGSSRGLGKIITGRFLEEGCKAVITSSNTDELESAEEELRQASDQLLRIIADIRAEEQVKELIDQTVAKFGRLDILVNNAGVFKGGEIDAMDSKDLDLTFDINVKGTFLVTKYAVAQMKKQNSGQIFNICSIGSKMGLENLSAYCASKAALAIMGDSLKAELKPYGIRVTNVFPHSINSQKQDIDDDSAKRRQMIEPEDIADAVVMVASSKEYVQYQDITIFPYSTKLTKSEE